MALTVTDIEKSAQWYALTLGLVAVSPIYDVRADNSPLARVAAALFGQDIKRLRILQMATQDGVGVELFQLVDPAPPRHVEIQRSGIIHFAFIATDFDAAISRLKKLGAMSIVENDADPLRRVAFFDDPDGNTLEIASSAWRGIPIR